MPDPKHAGVSDNFLGAIAYFTVVPALFFLAIAPYNKIAYVRYHAWQSTVFSAVAFIISLALSFFPAYTVFLGFFVLGVSSVVWLIWAFISLWCAFNALNGKRFKLPFIGTWAEKQANR